MKRYAILSAVLGTFGEDLDTIAAFTQVDMDLTVLAIHLGLTAYSARAHVDAVLDTAALEPVLAADLGSEKWLDLLQDIVGSQRVRIPQFTHGLQRHLKVVLDLKNHG